MKRILGLLLSFLLSCGIVEKVLFVSETYFVNLEGEGKGFFPHTTSTFEGEIDLLSSTKVSNAIDKIKRIEIESIEVFDNSIPLRDITFLTLYVIPSEGGEPYPFAEMPSSMDGITSVLSLSVLDIDLFPFLQEGRYLTFMADVSGISSFELYLKIKLTIIGNAKR